MANENESMPAAPYASTAEMAKDMQDARYTGGPGGAGRDPAFVALVQARLAAANTAAPVPALPVVPFAHEEDMIDAMADPRYRNDESYRNEVQERIKGMGAAPVRSSRVMTITYDGAGGWVSSEDTRAAVAAEQHDAALLAATPVNVPGLGDVLPFSSQAELVAAMSTPEYKRNEPLAHALVRARLAISRF